MDEQLRLPILALGPEFDGGEALNVDVVELVGGSVSLGNDDIVRVLKVLAQLLPCRLDGFAMAAPWRVELDQD